MAVTVLPRKKVKLVYQTERSECGLACICMLKNYFGSQSTLSSLRIEYPNVSGGMTLESLISVLNDEKLTTRALRLELHELAELKLPCILHWNFNHFVILEKIEGRRCYILDPAAGEKIYSLDDLSLRFTGIALEVGLGVDFVSGSTGTRINFLDLLVIEPKLVSTALKIVLLLLFLSLASLFFPIYALLTFDIGLSKRNTDWLLVLGLMFLFVQVSKVILGYSKEILAADLRRQLTFTISNNVFTHLVRLPVQYFQSRNVARVLSGLESSETLGKMFSEKLVGLAGDAMFFFFALVLLLYISVELTLLAFVFLVPAILMKMLGYAFGKSYKNSAAKDDSICRKMTRDIVSKIEAVKFECQEEKILSKWRRMQVDSLNSVARCDKYIAKQEAYYNMLVALELVATMFYGSILVNRLEINIGQYFAFILLKQNLVGSCSSIAQSISQFLQLRQMLDCVADIVQEKPEFERLRIDDFKPKLSGYLSVDSMEYRFPGAKTRLFSQLSFEASPSQLVFVHGQSGAGKTTLLKLLSGVLQQSAGSIVIDGWELSEYGVREFRRDMSLCSKCPQVLPGTVTDNIVAASATYDKDRINEVTKIVEIYDLISKLPMNFQTPMNDLRAAFSESELQRLFIARAIYKSAQFLYFDDAFSSVDPSLSCEILKRIRDRGVTIVLAARYDSLISNIADASIELSDPASVNELTVVA